MNDAFNDPTVQAPTGPAETDTGYWWVSLAEVDAMGRKAARGAGYPWGMAEEAGRAARMLAAWQLPGPEALLAALDNTDSGFAAHSPLTETDQWHAPAGRLCPIATGAALSDRAMGLRDDALQVRLDVLLSPLLLVPFLCAAAQDLTVCWRLADSSVEVLATPAGPYCSDWSLVCAPVLDSPIISLTEEAVTDCRAKSAAAWRVGVETWRRLDRYAQHTYAPATAASREGAGAGSRDSD